MALADPPPLSCAHAGSIPSSRDPSWTGPVQTPHLETNTYRAQDHICHIELPTELASHRIKDTDAFTTLENTEYHGILQENTPDLSASNARSPQIPIDYLDFPDLISLEDSIQEHKRPFHKWMRSLRRRAAHKSVILDANTDGLSWHHLASEGACRTSLRRRFQHRKATSGSSFGFVSAVQSASVSLASASAMTRSRRNTTRSRGPSQTDHSSQASVCDPRLSEDSGTAERLVPIDATATQRSLQRRQILEELISTEESYIGDVRFLMNVYVTILASVPTLPMRLRSSINRNLTEIVELHEEILGDLHRAIPHSEYTQIDLSLPLEKSKSHYIGHRRWRSLDAVPENKTGDYWLQDIPGMVADPQVAAEVAKVFSKKMNQFFIYKEYGAKYEMMMKDVASAHETMPQWETYQKGLEVLASTLGSTKMNSDGSKKSLTIGDLLVKPIQRVCKYPLLFSELLKCTPVFDCPNSHMEIETALMRLREATAEINRATNDNQMKATLEKTWLLQDRLVFPERRLDAASKNQIRSFGHIQLCGALHVCWQSKEGVEGQYMICLLYSNLLCLASASRVDPIYTIQACINVNTAKIEDVDNGKGLQCHTAPCSWKLVFESDHQLYELVMAACSPQEEFEWRSRLCRPANQEQSTTDMNIYSTLSINMKSLGTVFRRPGTMARNMSMHRATTVGSNFPLSQVIVKNTGAASNNPQASISINRSRSFLTTNSRIPVLAPPRSERSRLEALLADVWSRDVLPFPGMALRSRSEHLVRNSASTMMRKLSVAGITGSFSRKANHDPPTCHGIEEPNFCDNGNQHYSKSSDNIPDSTINTHSSTGRLPKRPRTQGTVISSRESIKCDEKLGFSKAVEDRIVQAWSLTEIKPAASTVGGGEAPVLNTATTEIPRQCASLGSAKSLPYYETGEMPYPPIIDQPKNHGRRWRRVGGSKHEGKGQVLRSLFR